MGLCFARYVFLTFSRVVGIARFESVSRIAAASHDTMPLRSQRQDITYYFSQIFIRSLSGNYYLHSKYYLGLTEGWFPKGWLWRMFPRNENLHSGTFGCSPGTKTGARVRSHVPRNDENRNEGTFAKTTLLRNRPFVSQ